MFKITVIALLLTISLTFKPCEPFGTRIFYGDVVQDESS